MLQKAVLSVCITYFAFEGSYVSYYMLFLELISTYFGSDLV